MTPGEREILAADVARIAREAVAAHATAHDEFTLEDLSIAGAAAVGAFLRANAPGERPVRVAVLAHPSGNRGQVMISCIGPLFGDEDIGPDFGEG